MEQGYYLVSHTYEEKREQTHYYGVFQQGRQRADTRNVATTLFATAAAATGMLTAKEGRVLSFEM